MLSEEGRNDYADGYDVYGEGRKDDDYHAQENDCDDRHDDYDEGRKEGTFQTCQRERA